ncbi:putative Polysaccharide biosynthesis protein [Nitrososphaera viennensis EN76]|nr:putative Polysaccharide biosynthesis protein [Nitrososphaera viennensis EN76]
MNRLSRVRNLFGLEKGLLQVASGNTLASIIGAFFWLFMASIMRVEDYGRLNYYLAIISIVASISLLGLQNTVITYLAKGKTNIKYQANLIVLISNLIILPILFFIVQNIFVILSLIGLSFFTMSWAETLANKDYRKFSIIILSQRAVQVFLSILLYTVMGVDGVILGYALSTLTFAFNFFRSMSNFTMKLDDVKEKRSFIIHSYALTLSNSVTNNADKLLVTPLFGFGILGLYQISFQFFMFLSVIPLSIFQFLLPRESTHYQNKKVVILGLGTAVAFSIIFYFAIPPIISSFFDHFLESMQSAQIMIFGLIPMTANAIMTSRLFGRETSRPVFIAAVVYISALSILVLLLGRELGLIGLAIAALGSLVLQSVTLCIFLFFGRKNQSKI